MRRYYLEFLHLRKLLLLELAPPCEERRNVVAREMKAQTAVWAVAMPREANGTENEWIRSYLSLLVTSYIFADLWPWFLFAESLLGSQSFLCWWAQNTLTELSLEGPAAGPRDVVHHSRQLLNWVPGNYGKPTGTLLINAEITSNFQFLWSSLGKMCPKVTN